MQNEYQKIAKEIIQAVGGKDNIISIAHCATRLRLIVKDREIIDDDVIENIDKVKGSFFTSGQYQIILGTGIVNKVYSESISQGLSGTNKSEQSSAASQQNDNWFKRAIRVFGDIFVPIIPVLVATGLFMGVRGLIMQEEILAFFGMSPEAISPDFILLTEILTDTAFAFLPVLVCWSAVRTFGGSPILGIVLGLMLVHPSLPTSYDVAQNNADPLYFLEFIQVSGYQGSVLPAFIAGFLLAKIEKWFRKRIPNSLDLILTPFLSLLIMVILSLMVVGPIFREIETLLLSAVTFLIGLPAGIGGLIYGAINQIIVITGVHHALNLIEIQMLASTNWNTVNPISSASIIAQAGAALAVAMKTKSAKTKALAYPSVVSATLGITEPAIYGVNLRYIKPFIMGLIGGGVGGFLSALLGLKATGMSITAIPGTLLYLNDQLPLYILINIVSLVTAFTLTYLFGYSDKKVIKTKKKTTR
ncbi:sucrose-specific PTS transporter subunit IIBC [Oceanobacillus jeddahense]|uniref:Sucrose-specific PTS transporter subunit IIBC n=1 Tax=Oceanobacillus jeddahense TaxID=1462527 RepID=A0ABY5JVC7_9BACI|nr:sucrose-specific PTS transporter subunit IIBC [Oceanobacillus jeddahense]UUI03724.1 sucrose-specific PTS transporter subunit IIBC [Oceanobacillus jeddahense]